jgi:hypothetical protein
MPEYDRNCFHLKLEENNKTVHVLLRPFDVLVQRPANSSKEQRSLYHGQADGSAGALAIFAID